MRAFHLSPCQVGCQAWCLVASHGANGAPCDQGHPDFLRKKGILRAGGAREDQIFPRPYAASDTNYSGHCCYASVHSSPPVPPLRLRSLQPSAASASTRFERQKSSALPLHSGTPKSSVADSPPRYGSPQIAADSEFVTAPGRRMLQQVSALPRNSAVRSVNTAATCGAGAGLVRCCSAQYHRAAATS